VGGIEQLQIGNVGDRGWRHVLGEVQGEAVEHGGGGAALGRQVVAGDGRRDGVHQVDAQHVLRQQTLRA
jgi:hypothetical protein